MKQNLFCFGIAIFLLVFGGLIVNVAAAGETGADQTGQFEKLKAGFLGKTCEMAYADDAGHKGREAKLIMKEFTDSDSVSVKAKIEYKWDCPTASRSCTPGHSEHVVVVKYNAEYKRWEFEYPDMRGDHFNFYIVTDSKDAGLYGKRGTYSAKATCK